MKYNGWIYVVLFVTMYELLCYAIFTVVILGNKGDPLDKQIIVPLSHDFATMLFLIFTAVDFTLIMVITYLFISKLYKLMKLMRTKLLHKVFFFAKSLFVLNLFSYNKL